MAVRVEVKSESGCSSEPGKVLVYENDQLVAEIIAKVEFLIRVLFVSETKAPIP